MGNKSRGTLGLLSLLLALRSSGPEPRRGRDEPDFGYGDGLDAVFGKDLGGPNLDPSMIDLITVASKPFEELPNRGRKAWAELLKRLNEIDPAELDSVFVSIMVKDKTEPGQPCQGCGKVHERDAKTDVPGTLLIGAMLTSDKRNIPSMIRVSFAESNEPTHNFPTGEADFIERR